MPSDTPPFDAGLLSPATVGADAEVSDAAILAALVTAEVALARAWATSGLDAAGARVVSETFGWREAGEPCRTPRVNLAELAGAALSGGNPVIPLVPAMRAHVPAAARGAIHRGATSQDILDSALLFAARRACAAIDVDLRAVELSLASVAAAHRDRPAVARTLTQHAVPTTVGLRVATWLRGIRRARRRLADSAAALPAQLGGAAGTLAAPLHLARAVLGEEAGARAAAALPAVFAADLGLAAPAAPWHTTRFPITELADALVQVTDALGVMAADVATGSRPEIAEFAEGETGGSSAMPQKRNPTASVLVRAAALRAPHLGATLHSAAAVAVDERPDGAWHAEWAALRDLLRLVLGAAATARRSAAGLAVNADAVARNLALSGGLVVAERLSVELGPVLGADVVARIVADAGDGADLPTLVTAALGESDPGSGPTPADVTALLDPAGYTGLAASLVDRILEEDA